MLNEKILTVDKLADILGKARTGGKKIAHCHGVYDLLHIGHINHLQAAKRLGDVLAVTVTPDKYVNKGPHRPAFPERLRAKALAALDCVDYVAVNEWPTAIETIGMLQPDFYVKGKDPGNGKRDHSDAIECEEQAIQAVGGQLMLTDEETFSSSSLLNRHTDLLGPEVKTFLSKFTERHRPEQIIGVLQSIQKLKVLTIGETILDEYHFCSVMGKANKDPILAARYNHKQCYAGGILAIANHLRNFCDDVTVLTLLGEQDSEEDFIRSALHDGINKEFLYKSDSPTIVKRRFIEEYLSRKLFEVYVMDDKPLTQADEDELCAKLDATLDQYDLVIVADYGHGMLTKRAISLICEKSKYLAVNVQVNAGNRGFNFITKYPRADFVSIDEPEARLETRSHNAQLQSVVKTIALKMDCPRFLVTRGAKGCLCFDKQEGFREFPAFAVKVIDRIGVGDALLAISAPCLAVGAPTDQVGFIANVVGAQACAIMGNQRAVDQVSLFRHITSLMK